MGILPDDLYVELEAWRLRAAFAVLFQSGREGVRRSAFNSLNNMHFLESAPVAMRTRPRGVRTPRALSAAAMARSDVAPAVLWALVFHGW